MDGQGSERYGILVLHCSSSCLFFYICVPFSNCLALESRWIPLPVCSVFIVFSEACDSGQGAVLLSVARGKVAEGIDFD